MSYKVVYKDYLRSSTKHLHTCQCLMDTIDSKKCLNKQISLLNNIYYLSGYVAEMALKYSIFRGIRYDNNKNVTELNQNDLTYKKDIKIHNLVRLLSLSQKIRSLNLNIRWSIVQKWDINDRYTVNKKIKYEDVKNMLNESQKILKECSSY